MSDFASLKLPSPFNGDDADAIVYEKLLSKVDVPDYATDEQKFVTFACAYTFYSARKKRTICSARTTGQSIDENYLNILNSQNAQDGSVNDFLTTAVSILKRYNKQTELQSIKKILSDFDAMPRENRSWVVSLWKFILDGVYHFWVLVLGVLFVWAVAALAGWLMPDVVNAILGLIDKTLEPFRDLPARPPVGQSWRG